MIKHLSISSLFLMVSVTLIGACEGNKKLNEYGYVFHESTGQNQYISREGREDPIRFDESSNQIALKSLHALKSGILIENNKGEQIFLVGDYDAQSQSFRLNHWYIKTPFEEMDTEVETQVPQKVHKVTRQSLERTDFDSRNGFNPNDAAFDPKSFQKMR